MLLITLLTQASSAQSSNILHDINDKTSRGYSIILCDKQSQMVVLFLFNIINDINDLVNDINDIINEINGKE